jgi:hypothetical protein
MGEQVLHFTPKQTNDDDDLTMVGDAEIKDFKPMQKKSVQAVLESFFSEDLDGVLIIGKRAGKHEFLYNWSRGINVLDFSGRCHYVSRKLEDIHDRFLDDEEG